jgi:hypothetical protein
MFGIHAQVGGFASPLQDTVYAAKGRNTITVAVKQIIARRTLPSEPCRRGISHARSHRDVICMIDSIVGRLRALHLLGMQPDRADGEQTRSAQPTKSAQRALDLQKINHPCIDQTITKSSQSSCTILYSVFIYIYLKSYP